VPRAWRAARGLLRAAIVRYPLAADAVLAAVWLAPGGDFLGHQLAVGGMLLPLQLALVLPLVWRRRAPLAVFAAMAAVALAQWAAGLYPMMADVGLLVALYTVAAHRAARQALLASGVLELGVLLACLQWVPRPEFFKAVIAMSAGARGRRGGRQCADSAGVSGLVGGPRAATGA
jgi:hypothetical protein